MNLPDLHCHSTFSSAMTAGDALWLAGLLEGEAWFGERRGEGRSPRPMIALKMCDRDVVERVADLFGTAVTYTPREIGQDQWTTRCQGKRAIEIMKQILPHMGKRRTEKIEMLLWMHEDAPLGIQPRCQCGKCPLCRNRDAQRRHREKKRQAQ